jgi:hypothetical protein
MTPLRELAAQTEGGTGATSPSRHTCRNCHLLAVLELERATLQDKRWRGQAGEPIGRTSGGHSGGQVEGNSGGHMGATREDHGGPSWAKNNRTASAGHKETSSRTPISLELMGEHEPPQESRGSQSSFSAGGRMVESGRKWRVWGKWAGLPFPAHGSISKGP